MFDELSADNVLEAVILDKGYDADRIRERLGIEGIEPVIPPISSRAQVIAYDRDRYRSRNRIERFFNKLNHFRRIATRYAKLADTFFSALYLVAAFVIAKNS